LSAWNCSGMFVLASKNTSCASDGFRE
jgi:hypothetical protein